MNTDFKPKWIPWDEDSFRADRVVNRMNCTQRALYRSLIIECYYNPYRPYLLDDDSKLWKLADAEDIEQWLENKPTIMEKFQSVTGDDGTPMLMNKRVMEEWEGLERCLAQKKHAAANSVAARRARVQEKSPQTPLKNRSEDKKIEHNTTEHNTTERSNVRSNVRSNGCSNECSNGRSISVVGVEDEALKWIVRESKSSGVAISPDLARELLRGRDAEAVKGSLESFFESDHTGLHSPEAYLRKKFAGMYDPDAKPRAQLTPEQEAVIRANIDKQIEEDRAANAALFAARKQEDIAAANFDPFA